MTEREKWAVIFEEADAMLDTPESVPEAVRRNYAERLRTAALRAPASEGEAVKVWCDECEGSGDVGRKGGPNDLYDVMSEACATCKGKGYTLATHPAPATVTDATMRALRSAISGRDADDDERTPRYGMLRVRELVEIHAALGGGL